jgi:glycosyltransferase involved in cell wall biosynthesis
MRVAALVPYPLGTAPSQRFRLEQWKPFLESDGVRLEMIPFADPPLMRLLHKPGHLVAKALLTAAAFGRRLKAVVAAREVDAIVVHRSASLLGPAFLEAALARSGKPMIFDFDDAIFLLHTTEANRRFGWLKFPGKTRKICQFSTHVVAGNTYLAEYARRFNNKVSIVPPSVDTEAFRPARRTAPNRVVVGWTGSSTSQAHLEDFQPTLRELVRHWDIEIRVFSDRQPSLPELPVTWRPWAPDIEAAEISQFDIGIMPVPDDPWSKGKCAMKALLYMAAGVATVCSPVGANCELIEHGRNGLLASTRREWIETLEMLIKNEELRRRLGCAGRQTVERGYSARHCARLFGDVIREVVES